MSRAGWLRGGRAETLAIWWLRLRFWRIVARRYRQGRGTGAGEIDIIARRGKVLAFIEVKARPSLAEAAEAIQPRQQARIIRAAEAFLAAQPQLAPLSPRFDAILVAPGHWPRHVRDAWRA